MCPKTASFIHRNPLFVLTNSSVANFEPCHLNINKNENHYKFTNREKRSVYFILSFEEKKSTFTISCLRNNYLVIPISYLVIAGQFSCNYVVITRYLSSNFELVSRNNKILSRNYDIISNETVGSNFFLW